MAFEFADGRRFSTVLERDIDLLLLEEFHASSDWCNWFYKRLTTAVAHLPIADSLGVEAAHSVSGIGDDGKLGETDLVVVFDIRSSTGVAKVVALIEDKVTSPFTENQPERYRSRARKVCRDYQCEFAVTALVAPSSYQHIALHVFDLVIHLEDIANYFEQRALQTNGELCERFRHRAMMLANVCDSARRAPSGVIYDENNTSFHHAIEQYIVRRSTRLKPKQRAVRGYSSYGPGFDLPSKRRLIAAARRVEPTGLLELNCYWHLFEGKLRISFHNWRSLVPQLREWITLRLPPSLCIELAAKGNTLYIEYPGLPRCDIGNSVESQVDVVEAGIVSAEQFQDWFEQLVPQMEELLTSHHT